MSDLRDRLRSRKLPSVTVSIRLDSTVEADAAQSELEQAKSALYEAIKRDDPNLEPYQDRVTAAEAAYEPFLHHFEVQVIPPSQYEAIIAACPPTDEQREKRYAYNPETFRPALLAACVAGELTEDDWLEMESSGELTPGELNTLFSTAFRLNERAPDVTVGKGLSPTRS